MSAYDLIKKWRNRSKEIELRDEAVPRARCAYACAPDNWKRR